VQSPVPSSAVFSVFLLEAQIAEAPSARDFGRAALADGHCLVVVEQPEDKSYEAEPEGGSDDTRNFRVHAAQPIALLAHSRHVTTRVTRSQEYSSHGQKAAMRPH
jgi:hypothetical protein